MKKIILILSILFGISFYGFSQNKLSPIQIDNSIFGAVFKQNGKTIKQKKLYAILSTNNSTIPDAKKARDNYIGYCAFAYPGGFALGWCLGRAIAGGKVEPVMLVSGVALTAISIPFAISYNKQTKRAVSIYNDAITPQQEKNINLKVALQPTGLGLQLNF